MAMLPKTSAASASVDALPRRSHAQMMILRMPENHVVQHDGVGVSLLAKRRGSRPKAAPTRQTRIFIPARLKLSACWRASRPPPRRLLSKS
jgi:hypothetical protein